MMVVVVDFALPSERFELGQILQMETGTSVILETMVPLGEQTVPFFRVHDGENGFEASVQDHPTVNDIRVISTYDGEVLYAVDWDVSDDTFFEGLMATDAALLEAEGSAELWSFDVRFPSHDALSTFQDHCGEYEIPIDVRAIYNPVNPEAGPWFGLTTSQREALVRAVETGYYSIPRGVSTVELAGEFGISDQAMTERLRRGVRNLVSNTLMLEEERE